MGRDRIDVIRRKAAMGTTEPLPLTRREQLRLEFDRVRSEAEALDAERRADTSWITAGTDDCPFEPGHSHERPIWRHLSPADVAAIERGVGEGWRVP